MTKYFVDGDGVYLGGFDGAEPPEGAIEVPEPPDDGRQIWNGSAWEPVAAEVEAVADPLADLNEAVKALSDRIAALEAAS